MINKRPAAARGHADHGWLKTWHSFSFADYYDPAEMGWGPLRVINDDTVAPATGFGRHGHRDMEIITYLLAGPLSHGDSMDNAAVIRRPEVQRMSAGSGVMHSEFNASADEVVHLLQIWIEPDVHGIAPEYEQKAFPDAAKRGRLLPIATPDGRDGSLAIHQRASIYATLLAPGQAVTHALAPGRRAYVHVAGGAATLNGLALAAGDGAKIKDESALTLAATDDAEVLLFDLP
ncbi:MAG: quercetin 2,3-dioxygenase [Rhodocyclales bacterium GWA2_65_20]|nr:MAG: quercetin 2,3-dioxygenase [Rhodocyclales bacterium GWA2_65_20]